VQDLEEAELQGLLIGALQPLTVPAGEVIIQQGAANGDTFYVVNTGACDILVNGVQVATKGPGTAFGELALLYACPRAATVRARESTQLWVLHQRWYRLVTRSAAAFRLNQKVCAAISYILPGAHQCASTSDTRMVLLYRCHCCAMSRSLEI